MVSLSTVFIMTKGSLDHKTNYQSPFFLSHTSFYYLIGSKVTYMCVCVCVCASFPHFSIHYDRYLQILADSSIKPHEEIETNVSFEIRDFDIAACLYISCKCITPIRTTFMINELFRISKKQSFGYTEYLFIMNSS